MRSLDFFNGSHFECIDIDNNTTKRSSNAYKPLTFSTANTDDNDKNLLSWLDQITFKPIDSSTLNITIDSESDTLSTNTKEYIDHCEKLVSKVYTNKPNKNKSEIGEKAMTNKAKPNPRNYTILPEIDDYKIYKDKQGRDVAMVVTFTDGTKTKAVCNYDEGDKFDIQSGIAICYMRRLLGDVNIDPKTLEKDDKKKSLGYTEYNRFMRKVVRNHEKKIKKAEKEKERKAKELKERQEIEAKRREKNQKKKLEELAPVIDAIKSINSNSKDVIDNPVDILKNFLFNDNNK